jgi:hypothetical protein
MSAGLREELVADMTHELMLDHGCVRQGQACRTCSRRARLILDRVLDRPGGVLDRLEGEGEEEEAKR